MRPTAFYFFFIVLIAGSCAGDPPMGHPRATGFSPSKVLIQSSKNLYVTLDNSNERHLVANEVDKTKADTFYLCDLRNNIIAFQSMNGLYVSVHPSHNNNAIIRQIYIFDAEKLKRIPKDGGVLLQSVNGHYLQPDTAQNNVLSGVANINKSCIFKIIELP